MSEIVIEREAADTVTGDAPEPIQQSHTAGNLGWVCPRCGRVNAPWAQMCPCVPPVPVQFTC